jgi:predicted transcriptional regulator
VSDRRPVGALETAVLECLWAAGEPMTPRQVLEAVDSELAYTTVVTILTRLADKGVVDRERQGKVYLYQPKMSEADLIAGRMTAALAAAGDRSATLSRFVESLPRREARALRALLENVEKGRRR